MGIQLGDKAKDRISGFEGICVSRTDYISGCTRVALQAGLDKDGKLIELQYFDEPMCDVSLAGAVTVPPPTDKGGPRPSPPSRHVPTR